MHLENQGSESIREEFLLLNRLFFVMRSIGIFVVALVLIGLWHSGLLWYNPKPILFILMPLMFLSSGFWWYLGHHSQKAEGILLAQLLADSAFIAAGIYFSGAGHSALHILILVPLFSAALVSRRSVIMVFLSTAFFMLAMAYGEYSGFLLPPGLFAEKEGLFVGWNNFFRPSWVIAVAALISFQGFYFISRMKQFDQKIAGLKDEFFFRTVHDLRSPLTALRWLTEKYSKKAQAGGEFAKDMSAFHDLELRMLELIKDALAVSRGELGGQFETKQKFDPAKFIESLLVPYTESVKQKNISLKLIKPEKEFMVFISQDLLKEVVVNLVDNAIKYNHPNGSVEVKIYKNNNGVKIEVSDTGLGISEAGKVKLFTPYFRDENVKSLPGTGLGLYLVKKILEKANGSIKFQSELNKGTDFIVEIEG